MTSSIGGRGQGRGKVILFGEHAVVHGRPAIACALDRGATARVTKARDLPLRISHPQGVIEDSPQLWRALDALFAVFGADASQWSIEIDIAIPVGVGLGSSAAMAVAVARAMADALNLQGPEAERLIEQAASASESAIHGTPSGIDQRAAMGDDFFSFARRPEDAPSVTPIVAAPSTWVVAPVAPPSSTADMVDAVSSRHREQPELCDHIFDTIAEISHRGRTALQRGDRRAIGQLMNINQGLLNALGTSTPTLEEACHRAREAGALGAKLTGAGGGGCIIALAPTTGARPIADALSAMGQALIVTLPSGQD